jgi:hypothetical protein
MHGNVINVLPNVDQTQSILPCLPYDGATICVFFKRRFEYKSLYMLGNVRPNICHGRDSVKPTFQHWSFQ